MRKLMIYILLIVGLLTFGIFIWTKITAYKNKALMNDVASIAQKEVDLIQLPNELVTERFKDISPQGCIYDNKVGASRCASQFQKYYAVNTDPYVELTKVDTYLTSIGWIRNTDTLETLEQYKRLKAIGYMPGVTYRKDNKYRLELLVKFPDYNEINKYNSGSEYTKRINHILANYLPKYSSIYYVEVSTDVVR